MPTYQDLLKAMNSKKDDEDQEDSGQSSDSSAQSQEEPSTYFPEIPAVFRKKDQSAEEDSSPSEEPDQEDDDTEVAAKEKAPEPDKVEAYKQALQKMSDLKSGKIAPNANLSDNIGALLGIQSDQLKGAQESRNVNQLMALLGKSGATIGASLARAKPETEGFNNLLQAANQPVEDVMNQQRAQGTGIQNINAIRATQDQAKKSNPESDISQIGRELAKEISKSAKLDIKIPDNISLTDLEKLIPGIEKLASNQINKDYLKSKLAGSNQDKQDKEITKLSTKMGEDLDPNRARSGELGKNQARINAAGRLEALLQQFPNGNIPKIQTRELATSLGNLLSSGSQNAVQQINELVPHTMKGNAAEIAEWFTGKPQGQQQQQFIKMYADTAAREKKTAQDQMISAQFQKAYGTHTALKKKDPDTFYNTLSVKTGVPIESIKEMESQPGFNGTVLKSNKNSEAPKSHPQDEQAIKWARDPNSPHWTAEQAAAILKANGLQQ